jgi:hypothetical protein
MKPQDFFIGIRDFFAIWVPGAVFLILLALKGPEPLMTQGLGLLTFAIAAYVVGSVASGAGTLLDFPVDAVLQSKWFGRTVGKKLSRRKVVASDIQKELLKGCPASSAVHSSESAKSFWWDHLRLNCAPAIAELDRIEAAQKLFRSLTIAFTGLALVKASKSHFVPLVDRPLYLVIGAIASFLLYFAGRWSFRSTLYRLAASYWVKRCTTANGAQTALEEGQDRGD